MPKANVARNPAYQIPSPYPNQPPFWVRGLEEEHTIKEQSYYTNVRIEPGDLVLDVGAHIGCSARYFLARGAGHVICYEAMPDNTQILEMNAEGLAVTPVGAAIIAGDETTLQMWTPNTKFSTVHSHIYKKGRIGTVVPAIKFIKVVEHYKPTVLKMDTEGGELTLIEQLGQMHPYVRSVAMEIHYTTPDSRALAAQLLHTMHQHYDLVQAPKYLDKSWNTDIVIWERRATS